MLILPQSTNQPIDALCFSPDGMTLACTAGKGRGVRLWDLGTRQICIALEGQFGRVVSVAFSPDGELLAAASAIGELWLWDVTGERSSLLRQVMWPHDITLAPGRITFSPDGHQLATTFRGRLNDYQFGVKLIPVPRGEIPDPPVQHLPPMYHQGPTDLAFSPDGRLLATGGFNRTVALTDVERRTCVAKMQFGQKVHYLVYSPDARTLAAGNPQGLVQLWDMPTGRKRLTLKGQEKPLRAMCYSPDGGVLVTAGGEGVVSFWDVRSGKSRAAFDWGIGEVRSVAFAPDGMRAAAGGRGQVVIWDIDGWEV